MNISQIVILAGLIAGSLLVLFIMALAQHKRGATGELNLVGALALVETALEPEGSILIRGEMWRARTRRGTLVERGRMVRVVGASDHLLEVEPVA